MNLYCVDANNIRQIFGMVSIFVFDGAVDGADPADEAGNHWFLADEYFQWPELITKRLFSWHGSQLNVDLTKKHRICVAV